MTALTKSTESVKTSRKRDFHGRKKKRSRNSQLEQREHPLPCHNSDQSDGESSHSDCDVTLVSGRTPFHHVTGHMTIDGNDELTSIANENELYREVDVTLTPLPGFRRVSHSIRDEDSESLECSSDGSDVIPTLVPSGSFEDTDEDGEVADVIMPSGNKVGDLDPSAPWRRLRPPMQRGTSLPIPMNKDGRPKSAEFHLDLNHGTSTKMKPPIGRQGLGHVRSPSDGDKHFLSLIRNGSTVRDKSPRDSPQRSPSPNSSSFLHRFGLWTLRRSSSREKDPIKSSLSKEIPAEQNNNNNLKLKVTSNTNTTTAESERHRPRLRFRKYSTGAVTALRDQNQNQPPSPPIAVFSSDEDISSVPNTPKHHLQVPTATTSTTSTSYSSSAPSSTALRSLSPASIQSRNIPTRAASYWGDKRPRPISPRLEQEISTLLTSPTEKVKPLPTGPDHENANVKPAGHEERPAELTRPNLSRLQKQNRQEQSKRDQNVPVVRYRRYAERKHHSADMVDQAPPSQTGPTRYCPQSITSSADTAVPAAGSVGQRLYARQRHHTVELANIIIKTPDDHHDKSEFVASNIEKRSATNHRNIGIDSYRRISPGGAYIVHMSPSRWSRPHSSIEDSLSPQRGPGLSSYSNTTSRLSQPTPKPSSEDVTLFHHKVTPISGYAPVTRSASRPNTTSDENVLQPNRLSSGYWSSRQSSRSNSPHSTIVQSNSRVSRPESPMTPHPTSPRRSTPPSPHSSLPPSPATTSPRVSTVCEPGEDFVPGVRRSLGRITPQDLAKVASIIGGTEVSGDSGERDQAQPAITPNKVGLIFKLTQHVNMVDDY